MIYLTVLNKAAGDCYIMDKEKLTIELIEAFDSVNKTDILNRFRIALKGEDLLICILVRMGGVSTPGQIGEFVEYTPARLSAVLKNLESKGFITKRQDELDKRYSIIEITDKGLEYERELEKEVIGNSLFIVEQLGEKDCAEFLRIVKRLVEIAKSEKKTV